MRDDCVELVGVEALEQTAGDPHAGVPRRVAEGEGIGRAVVHDAQLHQWNTGLAAPLGDQLTDHVVGEIAAAGPVDHGRRDQPLDDPGVDGELDADHDDGEGDREPHRRPQEEHEREPDDQQQAEQPRDRRQRLADDEAHVTPPLRSQSYGDRRT